MALGDATQKSTLFLHPSGYHLPVALPCVFIAIERGLWGLASIDMLLWMVYAGVHILGKGTWVFSAVKKCTGINSCCGIQASCCCDSCCKTTTSSWCNWSSILAFFTKFFARGACTAIPVITWLFCQPGGGDINAIALFTIVIAGLNLLKWAAALDWVLGTYTPVPETPTPTEIIHAEEIAQPVVVNVNSSGAISTPLRWRNKLI
jgi:hypothetical protein